MGTWAEGNFDNDGALDYLGEVIDSLVTSVEKILADEERVCLDEEGESELMPNVQIISILCEHCNGAPPKAEVVKRWRKKYLQVYDKQIDGLDPQGDYKTARRKVIENTFEKLEGQARSFWKRV